MDCSVFNNEKEKKSGKEMKTDLGSAICTTIDTPDGTKVEQTADGAEPKADTITIMEVEAVTKTENEVITKRTAETEAKAGVESDVKISAQQASKNTPKTGVSLENFESKSQLRMAILAFAWPCILELFLQSLIGMVNMMMVGHLGAYAITAVGITNQPVFISIAVFQSFNIGATALVARSIGAKEYDNAKLAAVQALLFAVISGVIMSVIGFVYARPIVIAMGAQPDVVPFAELYMKYMSVGIVFQSIPTAVSSLLRGAGDTKSPMRYNISSNIINVSCGFLLIYGFWFIPGLGIEGAAIGSTIAKLSACVQSIYIIFHCNLPIRLRLGEKLRLDLGMLKRIMNIGAAAAGEQLALRVGLLIFSKLVADLGTVAFAAHQVGLNINGLSFNIGQALGMAATSFMGQSLGAHKPELAEAYCKETRRMGMTVSVLVSASFFFLGKYIAGMYTTDLQVVDKVALLLKIIAINLPAQTSQLILSGGLRGAGDTRWPLIAAMTGILVVRTILAYLFVTILQWGLVGAWVAMTVDQLVRSVIILFRFNTNKWKETRV